jgi:hypothetical protein
LVEGWIDGQMIGWVYVEHTEIFFFLLSEDVAKRYGFQNFMTDIFIAFSHSPNIF